MKFKRKHKKAWIIILLIVLIIIAAYIAVNIAIQPAAFSLAESKLKAIANKSISNAVDKTFGSNINYSDLVDIEKDATGKIVSISANAVNINNLASEVSTDVQEEIAGLGRQGIDIPIGTVIGSSLLTGRGPSINVAFEPVGSANAVFLTAFEEAGINQTRQLIYLEVQVNIRIVISNVVKQVDYSSTLLIADTVIVGGIPEQYMNFENPGGKQSLIPMLLMNQYSGGNNKP